MSNFYPQIYRNTRIYKNGEPQNSTNVIFQKIGESINLQILEFNISPYLPQPNRIQNLLESPIYTIDIFDDNGQSDEDCNILEKLKPGLK